MSSRPDVPRERRTRDATTAGAEAGPEVGEDWVGWCCSYCAGPLRPRGRGLYCEAEGRSFGSTDGVHRLLPEDRLGRRRWRVLEVGAGSAWARLLERGHSVVATGVDLDAEDGLRAPNRFLDAPSRLPRGEAEMDALPLEPGRFDLVLVAGALHHAPRLGSALLEMRRVTRRGGLLIVTDSPVLRRREDGEAMVASRIEAMSRRYGVSVPRDRYAGFLVKGELVGAFQAAGWGIEVHGWPSLPAEWVRDFVEIARHGRRTARLPVIVGRRDGD